MREFVRTVAKRVIIALTNSPINQITSPGLWAAVAELPIVLAMVLGAPLAAAASTAIYSELTARETSLWNPRGSEPVLIT